MSGGVPHAKWCGIMAAVVVKPREEARFKMMSKSLYLGGVQRAVVDLAVESAAADLRP